MVALAVPSAAETGPDALLSNQIADRLRDLIVTEELPAGAPLPERALADRLGVSRTPLRDALKALAADGLVALTPKRGAVVARLSEAAVAEKLDILAVLEGFAGERAAVLASDAEIAEVRALHHELLAAFERRDRTAYFHLNQAIHRALVVAARNQNLITLHSQLNRQLYAYRWRGSADLTLWTTAITEHGQLVDLLVKRDAAGLAAALRAHVGSTWRQLRRNTEGEMRSGASPSSAEEPA
ncbi:MAG: GntR family transcriptional regulator [Phreatobacter sp.]